MYAIIQDGGHQLRVCPGDVCRVQKKEAEVGSTVDFTQVAAVGGDDLRVGAPFLSGVTVQATVLRQIKGKKLVIRQFRRRNHNSRRKAGHRQRYTEIRIEAING